MIDQLIAVHIAQTRPCPSAETEDEFYQKHGSDPFVRLIAWLTSIRFNWKRDRTRSVRSLDTCGNSCRDQAALRPLA